MAGIDQAESAFAAALGANRPTEPANDPKEVRGLEELDFGGLEEPTDPDDLEDSEDARDAAKAAARARKKALKAEEEDDEEESEDTEESEDDEEESDDGEEEESEGDDADESEDLDLSQEFNVLVDGEEQKVTLKEMSEGYIRMETFHQRLNDLASAADSVRDHASKVVEDKKKYTDLIKQAEDFIEVLVPNKPNWDEMYEKDPKAARAYQTQYEAIMGRLEDLRKAGKDADSESNKNAEAVVKSYADAEYQKFLRDDPVLAQDAKKMQALLKDMHEYGVSAGFSPEELSQVYDHRMLRVLRDAAKFRALSKKVPSTTVKIKRAPKKATAKGKPGTRKGNVNRKAQRLQKTGSLNDAADLFKEFI